MCNFRVFSRSALKQSFLLGAGKDEHGMSTSEAYKVFKVDDA